MKTYERYLWIAGLILAGFAFQNQLNNNNNLQTLLVTYDAESKIQDAQISDFNIQLSVARDASYSNGFEAGKTQAGVALAGGGSLYNYTDGYHAAMSQVREEAHLDVAESLLTELNALRKMVPRLLNQVNVLTQENDYLHGDDLLDLLIDVDETYLEIITDLISDEEERTEDTSLKVD